MKSPADIKGIMPYAGSLFGIYQLLRRWTFHIVGNRFDEFRTARSPNHSEQARPPQRAPLQGQLEQQSSAELATDTGRQTPSISDPKAVAFDSEVQPLVPTNIDCGVARMLQRDIGNNPPRDWRRLITTESMTTRLEKLRTIVAKPAELQNFPDIAAYVQSFTEAIGGSDHPLLVQALFEKETRISSYLTFLARHKPTQLNELFFTRPQAENGPASL